MWVFLSWSLRGSSEPASQACGLTWILRPGVRLCIGVWGSSDTYFPPGYKTEVTFINPKFLIKCVLSCLGQLNWWHCHSFSVPVTFWFQTTDNLPNQAYQIKPTKPNLPDQAYQTKLTKPSQPNQVYQTKHTKLSLPNQTYQPKPSKPNLPNETFQNKPSKTNLPNQTYQSKPTKSNQPNLPNQTY